MIAYVDDMLIVLYELLDIKRGESDLLVERMQLCVECLGSLEEQVREELSDFNQAYIRDVLNFLLQTRVVKEDQPKLPIRLNRL